MWINTFLDVVLEGRKKKKVESPPYHTTASFSLRNSQELNLSLSHVHDPLLPLDHWYLMLYNYSLLVLYQDGESLI